MSSSLTQTNTITLRYALSLIACGGSLAPYPDPQRQIGTAEWRALRWLRAQPTFLQLVERCENAFFAWCESQVAWCESQVAWCESQESAEANDRQGHHEGEPYQLTQRGYWYRCVRRMCGTWHVG